MRRIFQLTEICKAGPCKEVDFAIVAQMEVDQTAATGADLTPWAFRTLAEHHCWLGLFIAEYATVNEDDEIDQCFAEHWIAWDGVYEFPLPRACATMDA